MGKSYSADMASKMFENQKQNAEDMLAIVGAKGNDEK